MPSKAKRPSSKKVAPNAFDGDSPSEQIASAILARYGDLEPSVAKIMHAGLTEPARLHAITLFQSSLGVDGDPMRSPVNAIDAGRSFESRSG